ncbi:LPD7 domain-containing protein [Variovorax sp. KK3]|uniref:LPD7 domain-containing protein n=1 Tax=Variovorax sp. KK3 TaxID=1855728 RepID=UPI00097C1CE5|nr:LPD7 domain-containing protein [Variovorax sp. KK3]
MLIRVNAASEGIKAYLETGRKKGREFERDLIDERIPLAGDIELLDAIIDAIETKRHGDARYLHITLGFAEQFTSAEACGPGQINAQRLHEIVEAYRELLMAAYDSSEYMLYAEAHIPKVTHELNASSGDYEARLPHVHIVIPTRNLESDRYLNPFGYGEATQWAAQAIQEQINQRFGLRSPLDSRRGSEGLQHPLSRHVAGFDGQSPKQIRAYLASLVASRQVDSFDGLVEAARAIGAVTVRRGKDDDYINVKPGWADKGINLKEFGRAVFAGAAEALRQDGSARDWDADVARWVEQGAFEARYVASPRMRKAYKAMTPEARAAFIDTRRAETRARLAAYDTPIENQLVDAAGAAIVQAVSRVEEGGTPTPRSVGLANRLARLIKDLKHGRPQPTHKPARRNRGAAAADRPDLREHSVRDGNTVRRRLGQDAREAAGAPEGQLGPDQGPSRNRSDAELKARADPRRVLDAAQRRFGIDPAVYGIAPGKDGTPRILHEGRQYNLGDFFTKHLQRLWAEARAILVECQPQDAGAGDASQSHHDPSDPGTDLGRDSQRAGLLRRAAAAVARGRQAIADPATIARYFRRRNLGAALEAALRGLRQDRAPDQEPLSAEERVARSAAAIARARLLARDPQRLRGALRRREIGQALAIALRRLTANPPRRSQTVIQTIAASMHRKDVAHDRLKSETNPAVVLAAAQRLYGIDVAQYTIGTGRDGLPRILHGGKQYNLGDFFTKHLRRPWAEAEQVLRDCYHASLAGALPPPDQVLWRQFNRWRSRAFEELAAKRAEEGAGFRARVLAARDLYKRRKAAAQPLAGRQRAAAVARARAERFVTEQTISGDRSQTKAASRVPPRNAHYREFLRSLASEGDTSALAELRRMAPHEAELDAKVTGAVSQPVFPLPSYTVDARGAVTYRSDAMPLVRDSAQGVAVLKADVKAYDAAIRVAIARYGRSLTFSGDDIFVAQMTAAARRTGLELTLRDASKPQAVPMVLRQRERFDR